MSPSRWATSSSRSPRAVAPLPGRGLDFIDPWGNRIQAVDYRAIQFSKRPEVLAAMGAEGLGKTEAAVREMADRGVAPGA